MGGIIFGFWPCWALVVSEKPKRSTHHDWRKRHPAPHTQRLNFSYQGSANQWDLEGKISTRYHIFCFSWNSRGTPVPGGALCIDCWCRKSSNSLPAFTVLSFGYGRAPGEVCKQAWYWQPTLCNPQGLQLRKAARARIGPAVLSDSGFWRKRSKSCGSRSRSQHEFTQGRSKPVGVPLLNVGAYSNDVIHWREAQVGGSHMV